VSGVLGIFETGNHWLERILHNKNCVNEELGNQRELTSEIGAFFNISFRFHNFLLVSHVVHSYNRSQQDAIFLYFILIYNSTCFGQTYCPSSGVLILQSQQ
jgi:hypothetical protein